MVGRKIVVVVARQIMKLDHLLVRRVMKDAKYRRN